MQSAWNAEHGQGHGISAQRCECLPLSKMCTFRHQPQLTGQRSPLVCFPMKDKFQQGRNGNFLLQELQHEQSARTRQTTQLHPRSRLFVPASISLRLKNLFDACCVISLWEARSNLLAVDDDLMSVDCSCVRTPQSIKFLYVPIVQCSDHLDHPLIICTVQCLEHCTPHHTNLALL